jgi:hypothetical protein
MTVFGLSGDDFGRCGHWLQCSASGNTDVQIDRQMAGIGSSSRTTAVWSLIQPGGTDHRPAPGPRGWQITGSRKIFAVKVPEGSRPNGIPPTALLRMTARKPEVVQQREQVYKSSKAPARYLTLAPVDLQSATRPRFQPKRYPDSIKSDLWKTVGNQPPNHSDIGRDLQKSQLSTCCNLGLYDF